MDHLYKEWALADWPKARGRVVVKKLAHRSVADMGWLAAMLVTRQSCICRVGARVSKEGGGVLALLRSCCGVVCNNSPTLNLAT